MKVSELIEVLANYDEDALVRVQRGDKFFAVTAATPTFDFLPTPEKHAPRIGVLIQ